jgi:hypothetical protein
MRDIYSSDINVNTRWKRHKQLLSFEVYHPKNNLSMPCGQIVLQMGIFCLENAVISCYNYRKIKGDKK